MGILVLDLGKETLTFSLVTDALVKLGREDEAYLKDSTVVSAIVSAICTKGHAKRAEGVVWHHKDKISGAEPCMYRSLLHGRHLRQNVKEARRIVKGVKTFGIMPELFCCNTFLRCLCKRNLKSNPSGLFPEALNVMEMRIYKIAPTMISYTILLSSR
ncbi:hypothetical protein LguiB_022894 [Lonicera macranthoides]